MDFGARGRRALPTCRSSAARRAFMAPRWRGRDQGPWSVWALGCTVVEAVERHGRRRTRPLHRIGYTQAVPEVPEVCPTQRLLGQVQAGQRCTAAQLLEHRLASARRASR
ncbi:hypothetical protein ZWY2020_044545 [Hordeum vulgare]|nr:hypothetical protein ZWY2020_044545 [Hordeum vulgare]